MAALADFLAFQGKRESADLLYQRAGLHNDRPSPVEAGAPTSQLSYNEYARLRTQADFWQEKVPLPLPFHVPDTSPTSLSSPSALAR